MLILDKHISSSKFQFYFILPSQKTTLSLYYTILQYLQHPNFYFPILLIKIIYLHNKIYFSFPFFPIFSSTFPRPLSPRLHCPVTTNAPPPCPPRHHCPLPTKIPSNQKLILKKKKKNPRRDPR